MKSTTLTTSNPDELPMQTLPRRVVSGVVTPFLMMVKYCAVLISA